MLEPSGRNFLKPGQTILRPIYPDPLAEANLAAQEMEAAKSKIETQDRINTIKKPSFYHFYGKILPAYTI